MYLLYVDEAGDSGIARSPTRYFALSGLVIHELRWRAYLDDLIDFRKQMRQRYSLKLREEFHSAAMITKPGELVRIPRHQRLAMIRHFADRMAAMEELGIPHDKVNVHGGAIALGHPIGASGARVLVTLLEAMRQRQAKIGIAALCIGGGEAVAMAVKAGD